MRIGDICTREVVTCVPGTSAVALAQLMRDRHVGDVVVVEAREGRDVPVGIVTDRDLVVQVIARHRDPDAVTASDMMGELATALESEAVYDAIWHMRRQGSRRLPVVDASNTLRGILTVDDVTRFLAEELTELFRTVPRQRQDEVRRLTPVDQ